MGCSRAKFRIRGVIYSFRLQTSVGVDVVGSASWFIFDKSRYWKTFVRRRRKRCRKGWKFQQSLAGRMFAARQISNSLFFSTSPTSLRSRFTVRESYKRINLYFTRWIRPPKSLQTARQGSTRLRAHLSDTYSARRAVRRTLSDAPPRVCDRHSWTCAHTYVQ